MRFCPLLLLLFFVGSNLSYGQDIDDVTMPELRPFCQPGCTNTSKSKGILVQYDFSPAYRLTSFGSDLRFGQEGSNFVRLNGKLNVKLKAPILLKDKLKMIMGLKYVRETFAFSQDPSADYVLHQNLTEYSLKSVGASFYMLRPFRGKTYFVLRMGAELNGDYDGFINFDPDFLSVSVASMIGWRVRSDLEFGFGLGYRNRVGRHTVVPFISYRQTFSPKWGIEATLPSKVAIRHNFSPNTILLSYVKVSGANYFLKEIPGFLGEGNELDYRRTELRPGFELQQKLVSLLWLSVNAGYRRDLRFNFNEPGGNARDRVFQTAAMDGIYFSTGVFLTPPSSSSLKKQEKKLQGF